MASVLATVRWLVTPRVVDTVLRSEVLYLSLAYFLIEPALKRSPWVDTRKGAYRGAMVAYNAVMCLFSLACFVCQAASINLDGGWLEPLRALAGEEAVPLFTDAYPSPAFASRLFAWPAAVFHYSKYVEYMDTAWLVLKGKEVSFLHRFHHFGAAWSTFFAISFGMEGIFIFVLLNSAVHTVMYAYYGATAAGVKVAFKPVITLLQICQFLAGFALGMPYPRLAAFSRTPEVVLAFAFMYGYVFCVLILFVRFFVADNFGKKKDGKKGGKAVANGVHKANGNGVAHADKNGAHSGKNGAHSNGVKKVQ